MFKEWQGSIFVINFFKRTKSFYGLLSKEKLCYIIKCLIMTLEPLGDVIFQRMNV